MAGPDRAAGFGRRGPQSPKASGPLAPWESGTASGGPKPRPHPSVRVTTAARPARRWPWPSAAEAPPRTPPRPGRRLPLWRCPGRGSQGSTTLTPLHPREGPSQDFRAVAEPGRRAAAMGSARSRRTLGSSGAREPGRACSAEAAGRVNPDRAFARPAQRSSSGAIG